jgi:hypothetical protein
MKSALILLLLVTARSAQAQTITVKQDTPGPCSVSVSGNHNRVFTCQGFDEKKASQILAIVNRIAANQLDPDVVMRKLDEIQKSLGDIQEANSPCRLMPEQRQKILAFLENQAKGVLVISANITASDSRAYADQIAEVFRTAGWSVRVDNAIITGPNIQGLWITVKDGRAPPISAGILHYALAAGGITTRGEYDPSIGDASETHLSIGSK